MSLWGFVWLARWEVDSRDAAIAYDFPELWRSLNEVETARFLVVLADMPLEASPCEALRRAPRVAEPPRRRNPLWRFRVPAIPDRFGVSGDLARKNMPVCRSG